MQSAGRNLLRAAISNEANLYSSSRALGTAAPEKDVKPKKEKKLNKKATHSLSYVQNMFRGMVVPDQAFPFPQALSEEQAENLTMLVPPTEQFMTEVNDAAWNDTNEKVHPDTVQVSC